MNKEDLLNGLEELSEQLNIGTKETTPIEEIERNLNFRREMETELDELLKKVGNEQEYVVSNKVIYDKRKTDLKDSLSLLDYQITELEERVGYYNQRNNFIIASEIVKLRKSIEDNNQRISIFQDEINKGNADNNKTLTGIVNSINVDIASLEKQIQNLEQEKIDNTNILKSFSDQTNSLKTRYDNDQKELNDLEKKISDVTYVDEIQLKKDNDRIAELRKQIIDSVDNNFSSFDFVQAINQIIVEVENETLTEQQVFEKLLVIKEIYNNRYKLNDQNREKVLGDVREQILFYEGEGQALRNKLDNKEENYRLHLAFENEIYKDENSNSNIDLKKYVNMFQSNNQKIADCKVAIKKVELQKEQLSENYHLLNNGIGFRLDNDNYKIYKLQKDILNAKLKELNLKLSNLNDQQNNINSQIKLIKKQTKIDDKLSRKSNKEQLIDVFAMKKDENKLKECTVMIESLKNKEQFLSRNVEANINLLLDRIRNNEIEVKPTEKEKDSKPIPFAFLGRAKDVVINKTKELWENKKIQKGLKHAVLVAVIGGTIFAGIKMFKKTGQVASPTPTYSSNNKPDDEKKPDFEMVIPKDDENDKPADIEKEPISSNKTKQKDKKPQPSPSPSPTVQEPSPEPVPVEPEPIPVEPEPIPVEPEPIPVELEPIVPSPSPIIYPSNPTYPDDRNTPSKPDNTFVLNEGETLYYKNKDGEIEVFSNDDKISSEDAAKDFEKKTGNKTTGKTDEYEGISEINYNDDGSVSVGVENSTNYTETTLVEDIRAGMSDEELERQNQEMLEIMKEMEELEKAQKEGGVSR